MAPADDSPDWLGWRRPALVKCPRQSCGAARGRFCTTGETNFRARFHHERRAAAAKLPDEQALAIAAQIEQDIRAALAASRMVRPPLSAEILESRRRTREAWAQMGRDALAEERAQQAAPRTVVTTRTTPQGETDHG